ncbi:MAG: 5-(carboxyamino)imidazole ribonucleotide mutase [Candidatus Omnitrophica bacterium]|nr:5-(carboxyamino)imidazole ribonucleotide mutase [Candidatus Omnitrophota bacterium]
MKKIAVIVGSESDKEQMEKGIEILKQFDIPYEFNVLSAHRDPDALHDYLGSLDEQVYSVIIAGAGMAAALPGCVAAQTLLPVIGVPMSGGALNGVDALYSIVQMPKGIPVGCMAIGASGAVNAAIYAARIMALSDGVLRKKLARHRESLKTGKQKSLPPSAA